MGTANVADTDWDSSMAEAEVALDAAPKPQTARCKWRLAVPLHGGGECCASFHMFCRNACFGSSWRCGLIQDS